MGKWRDMADDHDSDPRPRVLLLYYSYTGQSLKVLQAAGEVFRERGYDVHTAEIEFTDRRFAERFSRFPMRRVWPNMLSVLPAQTRRASGEIRIPDEVLDGEYDLICIGSPTWWRTTNMPIRSFLKSDEARQLLAGKPFAVFVVCRRYWRENFDDGTQTWREGGRSVHGRSPFHVSGRSDSLDAVADQLLGVGQYRDRYLGLRIPPTNVQPEQLEQTRAFASALADRLFGRDAAIPDRERCRPRCRVHLTCRSNPLPASNKSIARSATRTTGWPGSRPSAPPPPRWTR